jgi:hypothetical protein
MLGTFVIFKKVNRHPMGENSGNLVTLLAAHLTFRKIS